ncbi:MAG TPA: hypothetical protein PKE00_10855 [Planctomycetota bacterium]|nr:hypothetical protein [Planctomycetota bacterium]
MKSLGTLLVLFGIASIIFHFLGRELRVFSWIHQWGENVAWGIRGGSIVLGLVLTLLASKKASEA